MTFEEFQSGRVWCDDLAAKFPDDVLAGIYALACMHLALQWVSSG